MTYRVEIKATSGNSGSNVGHFDTLDEVRTFANRSVESLRDMEIYPGALVKIMKSSSGGSFIFSSSSKEDKNLYKEIEVKF